MLFMSYMYDIPNFNLSILIAYCQGWERYSKSSIEILDTGYLALEYRDTRYSIHFNNISHYFF